MAPLTGDMGIHILLNLERNSKISLRQKVRPGITHSVLQLSALVRKSQSYSVHITLNLWNSQSLEVHKKLASRRFQKSFYILLRSEMSKVRQGSLGAWPLRLERYGPLALEPKGPRGNANCAISPNQSIANKCQQCQHHPKFPPSKEAL